MRRPLALYAATLVLGVQVLLAALPVRGGTTPTSGCAGGMACCDVANACSSREAVQDCHAVAAEPATDAPCMKALGCGHSIPGVAVPSLEPLVLQRHAPFGAVLAEAAATATSHDLPWPFAPEPPPPPPRA